jgi:hypothetical protein
MHKNKKIIICKFNLKNKCQFGEKCKFRHISINELNDILNRMEDLKQENESLKLGLKEKSREIRNLEKKICDVTNDNVYALEKPLYSSLFKNNKRVNLKNKSIKKKENKELENSHDIENLYKLFHNLESRLNDLNNKSSNTLANVDKLYLSAKNSREKLIDQSEFNELISKVISKTNSDVKCLMLATSAYVQAHSKSLKENIDILKAKSVHDIEIAKSVPNFSVFIETAELKMEEDMKINKKLELNN